MDVVLPIALFIAGLLLIIKGGDFLVDAAIWIAEVTKIPEIIIGATVVSVCTTLPEILVSSFAVAIGNAESFQMAIGNAVGTMIFNVLFVVGLCVLIKPSKVNKKSFGEKGAILFAVSLLMLIFSATGGSFNLPESIILLFLFVLFIAFNIYDALRVTNNNSLKDKTASDGITAAFTRSAADGNKEASNTVKSINSDIKTHTAAVTETATAETSAAAAKADEKQKPAWLMLLMLVAGAAGIAFGANLLVDNGIKLADMLHISKELMGITFLAAGTSLPELVTSLTSLKKGTQGLGLGNILGANIINSTLLLGLCGIIAVSFGGLTVTRSTLLISIPVQIISSMLFIIPTALKGRTFKAQGAVMLAVYAVYMIIMILLTFSVINI